LIVVTFEQFMPCEPDTVFGAKKIICDAILN
jgi:hypothetical protein